MNKVVTYFLDVQGTLVRRDPATLKSRLIGGREALRRIREVGKRVFILSNAPRLTEEVHKDLASVGLDISLEEVITSAQVTGEYVLRKFGPSKLYVIGSDSFKAELAKYGHEAVDDGADVVVVGIDRQLTFEKLNKAFNMLLSGAKLVAAGMSRFIPEEKPTISIGPIAMALYYASGVRPINTGKPSRIMYTYALIKARSYPEESAVVSDDLEDLVMAKRMGMYTVLVLTGTTKKEDLERRGFKPDLVLENVDELAKYI
ncbi:putative sugar phosphatases of the HAD superfamily [Pyrobaculum oguniense TE7]|uniref:Sugar phosphatases of the HAD superfamily n=1 Tax=Pyrobaculum oguniense (strain DSM 13380 / JCM 10595 / TE7) TaxID=698757 RepID=H6Q9F4_PYROT|nr:putative sugar phosphatases of the HAD superfamily [Pyrobaculum oguniense TE7]